MKQIFSKVEKAILSGKMDNITLQRFSQLFNNKEQETEVKHLLTLHLDHITDYEEPNNNNLSFNRFWNIIQKKKNAKQNNFRFIHQWRKVAVAASILLIIGFAGFFSTNYILVQRQNVVFNGIKGEVTQTTLPDSSVVYLNSDSEIKYNTHTWTEKREVVLIGEAFFDVTHNQDQKFIVHTSGYDIEVLGTRFNVKDPIDGNNVVTTLCKGSIRINKTNSKCDGFIPFVLTPNEQLVFNKNDCEFEINKVESMREIAWRENKIVLKNSNFNELVKSLEVKYGVEITVADSTLLAFHYNGTIMNETLEETMAIIAMIMPIKYHLDGDTMVIKLINEKNIK